jgi:hypothetical protein
MEKTPLDTDSAQFHVAEYTSLHGEIRELVSEARTLERQALFATGAVWTWLATRDNQILLSVSWFIPVLFSIGGAIRAMALARAIENIATYIRQIENVLAARPQLQGWEYFRRQKPPPLGLVVSGLSISARLFWCLLIAVTLSVPLAVLWLYRS